MVSFLRPDIISRLEFVGGSVARGDGRSSRGRAPVGSVSGMWALFLSVLVAALCWPSKNNLAACLLSSVSRGVLCSSKASPCSNFEELPSETV